MPTYLNQILNMKPISPRSGDVKDKPNGPKGTRKRRIYWLRISPTTLLQVS